MVVRHWMTTEVITVNRHASIQEALSLMKHHSIRHLPVVEDDLRLVGWVTDADLRGVLIASMLEELSVEDVMVRDPYTVHPETSLEEAAQLTLEKRIGGLPVVADHQLVGVVTVVDILRAFISLIGILIQSSRIDVQFKDPATGLEQVTRLIREQGVEIISICHVPAREGRRAVYSLRLEKCELEPLVSWLREHDIEVIAAQA